MKQTVKKILAVLLAVLMLPGASLLGYLDPDSLFAVEASAAEYLTSGYCGEDGTNLAWTLDDEGTLTVTGTGRMAADAFKFDLRIKKAIIGEGVENIASSAFRECTNLVSVVIRNGAESIDDYAFNRCSKLADITMPDSLTSIGSDAFYYCRALTDITLPDSLTSIGTRAFEYCDGLTDIILPDSLTSIGSYAFCGCSRLTEIILPDSVTSVVSYAFRNCTSLTTVSVGAGLKNLAVDAFDGCSALSEISVSENNTVYASVDGILYNKAKTQLLLVPNAVSGDITIPATVEEFSYKAVNSCKKITAIHVEDGNPNYMSYDGVVYSADGKQVLCCPRGKVGSVVVRNGAESIDDYAFYECSKLTDITMPDSLTSIGTLAFYDCDGLTDITLPDSLTSIGIFAFAYCDGLTNIIMPDSLTSIDSHAFFLCSRLTEIILPDAVTSVGSYAFRNCTSLTTVSVGAGLKNLAVDAFDGCSALSEISVSENNTVYASVDGILYNKAKTQLLLVPNAVSGDITIPATVEEFSYKAVNSCKKITAIHVEDGNPNYMSYDGVVYSADGKQVLCCPRGKVGSVVVRNGAESIDDYAFYECSKLTDITMPDSLTSIGTLAFYDCDGLTEINIPPAIVKINNSIFANCGFTELTLPETVQSFDHASWSKLQTLTIENRYCEYTGTAAPTFAKTCTIRAYCGSPGHELAVKRLLNFESLGHTYLDWYVVMPATYEADGIERRDCAYCGGHEERVIPKLQQDVFTATFVADGKVVATVNFPKGATELTEPSVPAKDRYLGEWEDYTLSDSNLTINAVYTLIKSDNASEIKTDSSVVHYTGTDDVLLRISASADANVVKSTITNAVPLDIILVVDQSGSMDQTLGGKTKKVDALKSTALDFINSVYENAKQTGCDHRISLVGFGLSGNYDGYMKNENTELLTSGRGVVNYSDITASDYASSLLSVNVGGAVNAGLVAAVNKIDARGATAADLGFEMAKGVFANTDSSDRQRVVVFMTDGEPTYLNGFQTSVANSAIANAYTLKNAYQASVYSVGVFSNQQEKDRNIKAFMNAVSSGYPDARSMNNLGKGTDGEFFTTVNHTDALSSVFRSISTESLSHTAPFDNITFIKTLSQYVTLTSRQEQQLRMDLIRQYGITNDDILVTRKEDGTTTIQINGLTPEKMEHEDGTVTYQVAVEFFVSLNENAAISDEYLVDTEDSGVMLSPDAKGYEATFGTSVVTVSSKKTRVIFTINGEVYEISENIENGYAVAPEIEISDDWSFTAWNTSDQKAFNGLVLDATLEKAARTVIWHTADGDIVQTYVEGDFISAPAVSYNQEGYAFLSWNRSIPTTMPDENLEFTAVYGEHVHHYTSSVTKEMTCETDGVRTFTCSCGDTYSEVIAACGHNYEAITPSLEKEDAKCTFVCTNCGNRYEYALDYAVVSASGKRYKVLYEFRLTDDNLDYGFEPDGEIYIRIPLTEVHSATKKVEVYRTNPDGTKTKVPAVIEDGFLLITADHFTPYEVNFIVDCAEHTPEWIVTQEATCTQDGSRYSVCTECETVLTTEVIPKTGHTPKWIVTQEATCTQDGSRYSVCTECEAVLTTEVIPKTGHTDQNADGICDVCGEDLTAGCTHLCHSDNGFIQFIWKLICFFSRLFGIQENRTCICGKNHW